MRICQDPAATDPAAAAPTTAAATAVAAAFQPPAPATAQPVKTVPTVKPGIFTTEFLVTILIGVFAFVIASGLPADSPWVKFACLGLASLKALGYTQGRVAQKVAAITASGSAN